jgi:pimeloyl-ACP methyl ester carboxylesterase
MNDPTWLDRDAYPFTSRWHAVDGAQLHYLDEGPRGDPHPIVVVHGTPTWSFEWRHVIKALRAHRRVIAVDHLGFGLSDKPEDAAYEPAAHARRLAGLLAALGVTRVTLVVHDFGGPIGLGAFREHLDRVERLVFLNSWFWPLDDDARAVSISRFVRGLIGRFLYFWLSFSPRVLLPRALGDERVLTKAIHRHYLAPFALRRERRAPWVLGCELAGSSAFYATLWERRAELAGIPTAIVWGQRDPAFGPAYLTRLRTALPHASVRMLPGVGHFPAEESPAAVVSAILGAEPV